MFNNGWKVVQSDCRSGAAHMWIASNIGLGRRPDQSARRKEIDTIDYDSMVMDDPVSVWRGLAGSTIVPDPDC
jgi:hypothetical protein